MPDAAAIDAIDYIMSNYSQRNGVSEYGGWLYRLAGDVDPYTGEPFYSYTEPVAGTAKNINSGIFNEPCEGNIKVAAYHSHPGDAYNVGKLSQDDYNWAAFHGAYSIYMGTPPGLLLGYYANNFAARVRSVTWTVRHSY